jgi:MYXO-CTERM domain-containing protein
MWLEVDVLDASDRVIASSARYDDETDTLTEDAQARIYDVELGERQADGMVVSSFHFVLNDTLMHDTRIPPEGFDAPAETDSHPLGRDYANGDGTFRHYDEPSYTFAGLCGTGALRLRARLRFQSNSREYMEFLRDNAPDSALPELAGRSWGDVAYEAWRSHGGDQPIDMESVEVDLGASPGPCPEPDAAMSDDATVPTDASVVPSIDAAGTVDAGAGGGGGGCGCVVAPRTRGLSWLVVLGVVFVVGGRRRRRVSGSAR